MALLECLRCATRFAVGLLLCPHCLSEEFQEADVPKNTTWGGASYPQEPPRLSAPEAAPAEPEVVAPPAEVAPPEPVKEPEAAPEPEPDPELAPPPKPAKAAAPTLSAPKPAADE